MANLLLSEQSKQKQAQTLLILKLTYLSWKRSLVGSLGIYIQIQTFKGQKIAQNIVRILIHHFGNNNLMASTEISANPGMVKILESNGFKLFGKPWKSSIHEHFLGFFLKFK